MYSKLLLTFALIFCIYQSNAQDTNNKIVQTKGYQASYFRLPAVDFDPTATGQASGYGFGYNYGIRYNLTELGDNRSISLSVIPGLSIDYAIYSYDTPSASRSFTGWGGIHLPIMVGFNTGAGSTYDTASDFGFGLELGTDIQYLPLFINDSAGDLDVKQFYAPLCIQLNFRYWKTSTSRLREFFIRYDFANNDSKYDDNEEIKKPLVITLGWMTFINY